MTGPLFPVDPGDAGRDLRERLAEPGNARARALDAIVAVIAQDVAHEIMRSVGEGFPVEDACWHVAEWWARRLTEGLMDGLDTARTHLHDQEVPRW